MIDPAEVTIVIPHMGGTPETEYALDQCLKSLLETKPKEIKIITVTNGGKTDWEGDINIPEQGQCKAVNAGVAASETPWVLVTNDDMVYPPDWFYRLVVNEPFTGPFSCVSPKLIEPRPGAPTFEVYFCGGAGGDFDKKKFLEFDRNHSRQAPEIRTGFNLPFLIKRSLWETVGGYDVNYDPWGSNSDSDLEYKIRLAGIQPIQNTNSIVYHFSQTSGTFNPENQVHWSHNFAYFEHKWGFSRTDQGIWEANFHLPTVEEGRVFTPDWEGKYL